MPAGITTLTATVDGASGGDLKPNDSCKVGGETLASLHVSAGDVLTIAVGRKGANEGSADGVHAYGGGGAGSGALGAGGGGGSFVSNSTALLLAAGGGGGWGGRFGGGSGAGEGQNAQGGGPYDLSGNGGAGATPTGPGAGASSGGQTGGGPATSTTFGAGGDGVNGGGGGGGGYYGGGSGYSSEGAGGGGSGYASADTSLVTGASAGEAPCGDGKVIIGYQQLATSLTTAVTSPAVHTGSPMTDTATIHGGAWLTGTVTFALFGPNDPTCAGMPLQTVIVPAGSATVSSGPVTVSPMPAGVYRWTASYSGDAVNLPSSDGCGAAGESVLGGCDTVVTGTHAGLAVGAGTTCVANAQINGGISAGRSASLYIQNSIVNGSVSAASPATVQICGSSTGSVAVSGASGPVLIGNPANNCTANTINGSLVAGRQPWRWHHLRQHDHRRLDDHEQHAAVHREREPPLGRDRQPDPGVRTRPRWSGRLVRLLAKTWEALLHGCLDLLLFGRGAMLRHPRQSVSGMALVRDRILPLSGQSERLLAQLLAFLGAGQLLCHVDGDSRIDVPDHTTQRFRSGVRGPGGVVVEADGTHAIAVRQEMEPRCRVRLRG
ncbi:MAG: Ig-like domain-containing protein [Actinomycetota bacterium]|nr:Ig-like domain-containing protein [Actinomycetota bacterium]